MALYQGIERKYFNSTVKLPDNFEPIDIKSNLNQVLSPNHLTIDNHSHKLFYAILPFFSLKNL